MVVNWHFLHGEGGHPVPYGTAPLFGLFDEGHVGVSLFMTLSGYLFARLLDGRQIHYGAFLWNRFLRLVPLLAFVIVVAGIVRALQPDFDLLVYLSKIAWGVLRPTFPNGGWSITTEAHFYFILPLLLLLARRWSYAPLVVLVGTIAFRFAIHFFFDVQYWAYWTIIGRIDQFLLGIFAFQHRRLASGRAALAAAGLIAAVYYWFDAAGGWHSFPHKTIWVVLPTIEGACFATLIAWYAERPIRSRWMLPVEKAGEYSYSIYLLHYFFVLAAASLIHDHVMDISSFPVAFLWSLVFYACMVALGHLSYRFIESPFLRFRVRYLREGPEQPREAATAQASVVSTTGP
jgi:peptidoglycan/LPS O-acetylase OafA/YrhL